MEVSELTREDKQSIVVFYIALIKFLKAEKKLVFAEQDLSNAYNGLTDMAQQFLKEDIEDYVGGEESELVYRGLAFQEPNKRFVGKKEGSKVKLVSYNKRSIFSWSNDKIVAEAFAGRDAFGVVLKAYIPTDQIIFMTHVVKYYDEEYSSNPRYFQVTNSNHSLYNELLELVKNLGEDEAIVNHCRPITATIESKIGKWPKIKKESCALNFSNILKESA